MTSIDDYFDRQEEKRQKERTLPINEMDDITPIYDTDGLPFEKDGAFSDVEGLTAAPSESVKKQFYTRCRDKKRKRKLPEDIPPFGMSEAAITFSTNPLTRMILKEEAYSEVEEFAIGVADTIKRCYELNGKTLEEQIKTLNQYKEIIPKLAFDVLTVEGVLENFLPDEIYPLIIEKSRKAFFKGYERGVELRKKIIEQIKNELSPERKRILLEKLDDLSPFKKRASKILEERLIKIKLGEITHSEQSFF